MSTSAPDYASLATRVEQLAAERPDTYRRRLLFVAGLGYAYIALVIAALFGFVALLLLLAMFTVADLGSSFVGGVVRHALLMSALPGLGIIYFVVRGLTARGSAPQGLVIARDQAPRLFETLETARTATGAPPIHRVVLSDEFNAAVWRQSRFGLPGWTRNHLVLGLPLLDALSPDEAVAVIAHEFGHLQGRQAKLSGQIFRVQATWISLLDGLERGDRTVRFLFRPFFSRYVPYFIAYASVAVRGHELDADRVAASLAGPRSLGDGLTRLELVGARLAREFWPSLYERSKGSPDAPETVFTELSAVTRVAPATGRRVVTLDDILAQEGDAFDTHPPLRVRLAALGQDPRVPPPIDVSASEVLLGECLPALRDRMNATWRAEASDWWQEQYADACERADALQQLEAEAAGRAFSVREQWVHACLVELVRGEGAALSAFQALVRSRPRDAKAHLNVARLLLEQGDVAGIDSLEVAVRLDPWLAVPALGIVYEYLDERTFPAEHTLCARWLERVCQSLEQHADNQIAPPDRQLYPHGLSDVDLAPLIELLDGCDAVGEAYLVRQDWPAFPELTCYLLVAGIVRSARRDQAAVDGAYVALNGAPELPAITSFLVVPDAKDAVLRRVRQCPGSTIYQRTERGQQRRAA
ncbi:MAG: M48 family metalloprotease [Chloroflexi bacterium]|nr:M48 family metalloprotease [Chloroflexota bacterium]